MTHPPRDIVAATPGGKITQDMILGFIAMLQVSNAPQSAAKLRRLWLAEGLDGKAIPKQHRPTSVFQVACRSVQTRKTNSDRIHEIKVDEVLENEAECIYQITQLVRDKDKKLIEHPKAMRITFNKKTGAIEDEPLDKATYKSLKSLAQDIRDEFERNSSKVPGSKIRRAIRDTLRDQHATLIQNKGVFFVPKAGKVTLDSISNVLSGLYPHHGNGDLFILPCANDKPQREVIGEEFRAEISEQIDALLAEVSTRLKAEKPLRKDRQTSLVAERRRLKEAHERYKNMLDDKLLVVGEKISLLDDGLEELMTMPSTK